MILSRLNHSSEVQPCQGGSPNIKVLERYSSLLAEYRSFEHAERDGDLAYPLYASLAHYGLKVAGIILREDSQGLPYIRVCYYMNK